jgi:hypothetical protein
MITLPPYIPEWQAYREVPEKHRWIFNKIELEEALPVGLKFPVGDYCVRPAINISGSASGGFRRVVLTKPDFIREPYGHCVTPWTNDYREWHAFVDDECWYSQKTVDLTNEVETMVECEPCMVLPESLRGISRYLLVERLGDRIIDVGPRHDLYEMRQEVIADYWQFDPDYQPPSYGDWGFRPKFRHFYRDGAYYLEEIPND